MRCRLRLHRNRIAMDKSFHASSQRLCQPRILCKADAGEEGSPSAGIMRLWCLWSWESRTVVCSNIPEAACVLHCSYFHQ